MNNLLFKSAKQCLMKHHRLRQLIEPTAILLGIYRPSDQKMYAASYDYLFSSIVGGSVVVNVPELGNFEMNCRSDILRRILLKREYEPEVVEELRKYIDPNKDALDIGANVGLFTILLASLLSEDRRVLAVEPTPGALSCLKKNIEAHNLNGKVILFEGVMAENRGQTILNVIENREEYSSLLKLVSSEIHNEKVKEIEIPVETIDQLVKQHNLTPGLIKIDTEGAELRVLQGAFQTIMNYRPVILCEAWPDEMLKKAGGKPGAVIKLLMECGYAVRNCAQNEILAIPNEI